MKIKIISLIFLSLFSVNSYSNSILYQPTTSIEFNEIVPIMDRWMIDNSVIPLINKDNKTYDVLRSFGLGDESSIVLDIRKRLASAKLLDFEENKVYDVSVEDAVRRYQSIIGLYPTGIVSRTTFLNMYINSKYKEMAKKDFEMIQGKVAEDILKNNFKKYIIVNIPSATLKFYDLNKSDSVALESPLIVGRSARPTPLMKTFMVGLKYNPEWTVPKTILNNDIFPHLQKKDYAYIKDHKLFMYDRQGKELDYKKISKDEYFQNRYRFIQKPGMDNPLGILKFETDNDYNIYLHDTNTPFLFNDNDRFLSSGCIRVKKFKELAGMIKGVDKKEITESIKGGLTYVDSVEEIPIYIVYSLYDTINGRGMYFPDVYGIRGAKASIDKEEGNINSAPTIIANNEIKLTRKSSKYDKNIIENYPVFASYINDENKIDFSSNMFKVENKKVVAQLPKKHLIPKNIPVLIVPYQLSDKVNIARIESFSETKPLINTDVLVAKVDIKMKSVPQNKPTVIVPFQLSHDINIAKIESFAEIKPIIIEKIAILKNRVKYTTNEIPQSPLLKILAYKEKSPTVGEIVKPKVIVKNIQSDINPTMPKKAIAELVSTPKKPIVIAVVEPKIIEDRTKNVIAIVKPTTNNIIKKSVVVDLTMDKKIANVEPIKEVIPKKIVVATEIKKSSIVVEKEIDKDVLELFKGKPIQKVEIEVPKINKSVVVVKVKNIEELETILGEDEDLF